MNRLMTRVSVIRDMPRVGDLMRGAIFLQFLHQPAEKSNTTIFPVRCDDRMGEREGGRMENGWGGGRKKMLVYS